MQMTKEMLDHFYQRTKKHIDLVNKFILKISDYYYLDKDPLTARLLKTRLLAHDQSKYEDPELTPYVFITWNYYCKSNNINFTPPDNIKETMQKATYHHVKSNRHHPEFHDDNTTIDSINPKDRDKPPEQKVDGSKMSKVDIAEMVADWMAMSEEKGGEPSDWAKKNIGVRWKFTKEQENQIYDLIENIWKKKMSPEGDSGG